MKKFFIPLLTGVIVASVVLAGCAKAPAPAPAPAPAGIPAEPAGFPQPNPYWGLGFKPDGSPYKFVYVSADLALEVWVIDNKVCETQLRMAGAEVTSYNPRWNLERQVAIIEDVIQQHPDAIILYAVDTYGIGPVVDKAVQAGIPVFAVDILVDSDYLTMTATYDQYDMGYTVGEYFMDIAKKRDKHLAVLELLCPMSFEICVMRSEGFNDAVKDSPLVSVEIQSPSEANDELQMNAILDALPAHPDINAIYQDGGGPDGTIRALKQLGRWYPIGNPKHVVLNIGDATALTSDAIRTTYCDGSGLNSPWAMADITAKGVLWNICLGQSVPKEIVLPADMVTPENVDISPYGGPMRYGDMLEAVPDITTWPILDMEKYGMPTPHFTGG